MQGLEGRNQVLSTNELIQAALKDTVPGPYKEQKPIYKDCAALFNEYCENEFIWFRMS